jgi:prevent-host-death family protein
MVTHTLTDARNRHGEIFDEALAEPVLLTKNGRPTHVVLSAKLYENLLRRLEEAEDRAWGEAAMRAKATSPLVGSEKFTAALKRILDAEA